MPRIIAEHIDQYREENGIVKCYKVGDLIRCRNCKWWQDITEYRDFSICVDYGQSMNADDYCSRAERKEECQEEK